MNVETIKNDETIKRSNTFIKKAVHVIKRDWGAWLIMVPALLALLIFTYIPMVGGAYLSLCKTKAYDAVAFVGLNNFRDILTNSLFLKALGNCFKYVFWCFVIGWPLPIIMAILLNEIRRGQRLYRCLSYLPGMVPGIIASMVWAILLSPGQVGLLNNILGRFGIPPLEWLQDKNLVIPTIAMVMTWSGCCGTIVMYIANLQGVNSDLYEASAIDGAGFFRRVWYITLPTLAPLLKLGICSQVASTFTVFQQVYILTGGGPDNASMNLAMLVYQYTFNNMQAGHSAAISIVQCIILVTITLIFRWATRRSGEDE